MRWRRSSRRPGTSLRFAGERVRAQLEAQHVHREIGTRVRRNGPGSNTPVGGTPKRPSPGPSDEGAGEFEDGRRGDASYGVIVNVSEHAVAPPGPPAARSVTVCMPVPSTVPGLEHELDLALELVLELQTEAETEIGHGHGQGHGTRGLEVHLELELALALVSTTVLARPAPPASGRGERGRNGPAPDRAGAVAGQSQRQAGPLGRMPTSHDAAQGSASR
jgi:hypothetical protein